MSFVHKVKLKEYCHKITKGTTPTTLGLKFKKTGIPFIRVQNLVNGTLDLERDPLYIDIETHKTLKRSFIYPEDLLIGIAGTIGRCAIVPADSKVLNCNQAVAIIRVKDKIFNRFLFHWLNTDDAKKQILGSQVTATISNISLSQIGELKIPLPPLEEQKRIAAILDKADELRQKRKKTIEKLDELIQSIFLDMFGDPVTNPKGWEVKTIDDFAMLVSSGSTPLGGEKVYQREGIKFIRSQNVRMNKLDYRDLFFISKDIHNSMKRTWVKNNDVLLNITGASIGRVALYEGSDDDANVNQHVCIIRTNRKISSIYLSYLISMPSYQSHIVNKISGATRQAFNFNQIKNFFVALPPIKLQRDFENCIYGYKKIKKNIRKSETSLKSLFSSLTQKAFKGEL